MHHLVRLVCVGSSLVAFAGCMRGNDSGTGIDTAESAIDSSDGVSAEGNVMMAEVDGADMTGLTALTGDQVAVRVAANVALRWQPSGCATVDQQGATVTVTYNDCTGPRGLVHVTGTLTVVLSVSATGGISAHATATGFQVNRATLDIDADATYAVSGTSHSLTVTSTGEGTGPRGNAIDHQGDYTITWDTASQCGSIDGMWSTDITTPVATAERSNDVDLSRCAGGCPTGTMTHHFLGGASITVTFDGTATAAWTASTGRSGTVQLLCQP